MCYQQINIQLRAEGIKYKYLTLQYEIISFDKINILEITFVNRKIITLKSFIHLMSKVMIKLIHKLFQ